MTCLTGHSGAEMLRTQCQRVHLAVVAVDVDASPATTGLEFSMSPVLPFSCAARALVALRYVTTTAVPLAATMSIEPFWPTVS